MPAFPYDRKIRLGMTAQTKIVVAHNQHFFMNRAVDLMAGGAAFARRFVLKHVRAALFFVALEAGFINIL